VTAQPHDVFPLLTANRRAVDAEPVGPPTMGDSEEEVEGEEEPVVENLETRPEEIESADEKEIESTGEQEEIDPLEIALQRADSAEKEVAYRDATIATLRRNAASGRSEAMVSGAMRVARRFVGTVENLERSLASLPEDTAESVRLGIERVLERFVQDLEIEGIKRIITTGNAFDPMKHEAVMTVPPTEEAPAGTIVGETEAGWMYGDKVLRAARVAVASDIAA